MKPSGRPKIIYAWDYLQWGGAQIYFLALMKEVVKDFDVEVVLPAESDPQLLQFIADRGASIDLVDTKAETDAPASVQAKFGRHVRKFRSETRLLRKIFERDLSNTIVHIEIGPWQSLISLLRLTRRAKVFLTAHNSLGSVPQWRRRLWKAKFEVIARTGNFWLFPSNEDSKSYFAQFLPEWFVRERVRVTYTSVNPEEIATVLARPIDRDALMQRHGIPTGKTVVLCVGQFVDRKGRWTFLDAAKRLSHEQDPTFVWIANSRPSAEDLEKASSYGLGDRFRLLVGEDIGTRTDLLEMFRIADIFVLASFVEGLPISLLEAMALGIPSISTNVNAIPEAVRNMETGLLIEAGDGAGLAAAIQSLSNHAELRARLAETGRRWVLERFDEREVARIAIKTYRDALAI